MATENPYDSPVTATPQESAPNLAQRNARLPILVGVLGGMVAWILLASLESPSFYRISVWIFDETSPKLLFATPGYYCIHRTILLTLCLVGGSIGIAFSSMRTRNAILFLCGVIAIVGTFAAIFPR